MYYYINSTNGTSCEIKKPDVFHFLLMSKNKYFFTLSLSLILFQHPFQITSKLSKHLDFVKKSSSRYSRSFKIEIQAKF